jgi:SAM-dependent MidA family methyltransferase
MHDNPYINIGRQDITAHINFSSLCLWGKKYGLEFSGFTDQGHFLKALGFEDYLNKNLQVGGSRGYVLVKHILLKEMGEKLMVLIQNKSIPDFEPTGLKLAT